MPTYEYQCTRCGAVFDVFQSIKAAPLRKSHCPECDAIGPVRRLISTGGAVLFKGSGFYQTDYRSESYKKAASAESGDKKPDTPAADKPNPAKPAAATPPPDAGKPKPEDKPKS
jgi:putative FmdB family regulatory protein